MARAHYRPGRLRIGTLDSNNDHERLTFAFARKKGERLVQFQHGGVYGVARSSPLGVNSDYLLGVFMTWGWTAQENQRDRFIALPSPWLSKFTDRHRVTNDQLILVGTIIRFRFLRIGSLPQPSQLIPYLKGKVDFFHALAEAPRASAAYRAYPNDRGYNDLNDGDFVSRRFPGIPMVEGDLVGSILGCRLLIIDHNSTTLHLALAANVPTVCFWGDDAWSVCRQAQPYFDKLRECGILFDDPVLAAEHVNRVWDDVATWWDDEKLQQVRREWVRQLALNRRLWWVDWLKTLSHLQRSPS